MTDLGNLAVMERARGAARVGLVAKPGGWGLSDLYQQGSAKVILPVVEGGPEVVFLNTSGGLTGGDRLSYQAVLGDGITATATTQTAERAYRSTSGAATMTVRLEVGAGGWLDWLPQETILFDRAHLNRRTDIRLHPEARGCLAVESVVLGRAAMGETLRDIRFTDRREIWRGGRLMHTDPVSLTSATLGPDPAGLGGARAFASIVLMAQSAADALEPVRALLTEDGVRGAASALPGRLIIRLLAEDGWPMRRQIARLLTHIRRQPLPRVWQI